MSGSVKASLACGVFAVAGIVGFLLTPHSGICIALSLYYAVLLLNTFFSVRTISALTPPSAAHTIFDALLALVYFALAASFGSVALFSIASLFLFAFADVKYAHLARLVPSYRDFLYKKMRINFFGALLSGAALFAAYIGYPEFAAWGLATVYALANAYLLGINPMYRLEEAPRVR
jgi:hypothetical protein